MWTFKYFTAEVIICLITWNMPWLTFLKPEQLCILKHTGYQHIPKKGQGSYVIWGAVRMKGDGICQLLSFNSRLSVPDWHWRVLKFLRRKREGSMLSQLIPLLAFPPTGHARPLNSQRFTSLFHQLQCGSSFRSQLKHRLCEMVSSLLSLADQVMSMWLQGWVGGLSSPPSGSGSHSLQHWAGDSHAASSHSG